jgi:C_GCAxxG_C_C family probable redox protein
LKVNEAANCFREGFSCSQAIFSSYSPELGLDKETALKISGAYMVIGLKYATAELDPVTKEETYAKVREFAKKFKEKNKSTVCSELLGCNISTEEGMKEFKERQLITTLCADYVRNAAEILEEIL